jgi:hypothetical protein
MPITSPAQVFQKHKLLQKIMAVGGKEKCPVGASRYVYRIGASNM